jgi:hypothetical protein
MGKIIAGTASFRINGQPINLKGDLTYSTTQESAEGYKGVDGHAGIMVTPKLPFVEGTFSDQSDISTQDFEGLEGVDVQVDLRNGKKIVFPNCFQTGEVEVNGIEGSFSLRFECLGTPVEDVA